MLIPIFEKEPPSGRVFQMGRLRYFASGGQIIMIDERNGNQFALSPGEFEQRYKTLCRAMQGQSHNAADDSATLDERRRILQLAEHADQAVREARAQGDPTDPKVRAFWTRHASASAIPQVAAKRVYSDMAVRTPPDLPPLAAGARRSELPAELAAVVRAAQASVKQQSPITVIDSTGKVQQ